MHVALRHSEMLAGIMALSTYMVLPETMEAEASPANALTPLLTCHGTLDEVVLPARGRKSFDQIASWVAERPMEWHDYPMGHEVCIEELQAVGGWLREVLRVESP